MDLQAKWGQTQAWNPNDTGQSHASFSLDGNGSRREAKFEPHSFGFRPGRSAIDAASHIWCTLIHRKGCRPHPGWVFDADISKCFDNIDHKALLSKVEGSPFQGIIGAWLKSGSVSQVGFE